MNFYEKIAQMKPEQKNHWIDIPELSYWGERVFAEIACALELDDGKNGGKALAEQAVDLLYAEFERDHALSDRVCREAEKVLLPLEPAAKAHKTYFVGHAHIDMDWMWGYHETVSLTSDTFYTMLNLMDEYPEFTFSQSQAAVYEMMEEYDPETFERIKARIAEGRWEFAGSTWVELDKNLPSGESMARHILYTKRYLRDHLGIPCENVAGDFHPDSFGHAAAIPEIFAKGGIRWFYHCRGLDGTLVYRWKAPSGAEILSYNEPLWYNDSVRPMYLSVMHHFCKEFGVPVSMKIYGVGDHGGGPTRKDIETIIDFKSWPLAPQVEFGTYARFFGELEKYQANFPVLEGELGPTFTGCYTSQSLLKTANRIGEDRLSDGEALTALSLTAGGKPYRDNYAAAWKKLLFNQFHDILPGSCVPDSRSHAMGNFEDALSAAMVGSSRALRAFAASIDTSGYETPDEPLSSRSDGGGVGRGTEAQARWKLPAAERGRGPVRLEHVFNPTQYDRPGPTEISLWDWNGDPARLAAWDAQGKEVALQILDQKQNDWNHNRITLLIDGGAPAYGYATYRLAEKEKERFQFADYAPDPRVTYYHKNILENEYLRVELDDQTMAVRSIVDKESGKDLLRAPGGFVFTWENNALRGGSAWVEGVHTKEVDLHRDCKVLQTGQQLGGKLRQWVTYTASFEHSTMEVTLSLDAHARMFELSTQINWMEKAEKGEGIPQLSFRLPLAYDAKTYRYDVPFGIADRESEPLHDWYGRGFLCGVPAKGRGLSLMTDCRYGYRGWDNNLQVSILRASSGPDRFPELGERSARLAVGVSNGDPWDLHALSEAFCRQPASASNTAHKGSLPLGGQLLKVEGKAAVSSLKVAEDQDNAWIIRLYSLSDRTEKVVLTVQKPILSAEETDLAELPTGRELAFQNNTLRLVLEPYAVVTVKISF